MTWVGGFLIGAMIGWYLFLRTDEASQAMFKSWWRWLSK
jgi:hypothetical protein